MLTLLMIELSTSVLDATANVRTAGTCMFFLSEREVEVEVEFFFRSSALFLNRKTPINPLFLLFFYFTAKAKTHREIDRKLKHLCVREQRYFVSKRQREKASEREDVEMLA